MTFIEAKSVFLNFPVYSAGSRSLRGQLAGARVGGLFKKCPGEVTVVEALRDINLRFEEGDRVGLIGPNGAGKTTLLKVLAGVYDPTNGQLLSKGRISTLFSMGCGMDEDASGIENIQYSGLLLGMSRNEINEKLPAICEFTELGDFLSLPIRTYSAGMRTRLSFAVATAVEPEILLIDEIFGAGDQFFARKAKERMEALLENTRILVFASHSNKLIRSLCNKAVLLDHGEMIVYGDLEEVFDRYEHIGGA